jgi:hypothetical protein
MMAEMRRLLKVVFTPGPQSDAANSATIAIQANSFAFCEIAQNEFLVMAPSPDYGGERAMGDDLNENALGGTYKVTRPSREEIEAFNRSGKHLEK